MNVRVTNLDGSMYPISGGGQDLTVADTAVPLAALPAGTTSVFVAFDTANVRVRFDGVAPTTSTGVQFQPGEKGTWNKAMAEAARFIREDGTSGHVFAQAVQV